jgi:hypothetical protein
MTLTAAFRSFAKARDDAMRSVTKTVPVSQAAVRQYSDTKANTRLQYKCVLQAQTVVALD